MSNNHNWFCECRRCKRGSKAWRRFRGRHIRKEQRKQRAREEVRADRERQGYQVVVL